MNSSFGTWIKRRRKALDLTQRELAQRVGCSASAIFKIEADARRPSRQIAELLAKYLEIPSEQTALFLKIARQEKTIDLLETLPGPSYSQLLDQPQVETASIPRPDKTDLPISSLPLIGREYELDAIIQQLNEPHCRLLTLTGLGGVGKTRLALELANRLQGAYADGVYFIELAGVNSSDFIVSAIAKKMRLVSPGSGDLKVQLTNVLRDRQVLLVLDNLEHLLDGIGVLGELLEHTRNVKLLATSREALNLRAEWVFGVQGLPLPHDSMTAEIEASSAVKFFIRCAKQARADFELQAAERPAVLRICQLVEGLPLGIELAAAWVRVLSCAEIVREIEHNLSFLSSSVQDIPERHRSMEAVFRHSWELLTPDEQNTFMCLSIFRGGFTRAVAEQVAGASLSLLSALVDKSLLRWMDAGRYDLHELIRQYAHKQLAASGEFEAVCDRHLDFYMHFAEEAAAKLYSTDQFQWLDRLEQDNDNLRTALEWSLGGGGANPQKALRLAGALYWFWKRRDHWNEGREWLRRALAKSDGLPVGRERVVALNAAALLAAEQADTRSAIQFARENLRLSQQLRDLHDIATASNTLGFVLWKQKDFVEAHAHCEQGLVIFRKLGDRFATADSLHALGHITINQGDLDATQAYLEESLAISRKLESKIGIVEAVADLGLLAYLRNDYTTAYAYLEESLIRFREGNLIPGVVSALNRMGDLARCQNDYEKAGQLYSEGLSLYRQMGDLDEIPSMLQNLGYVALHRGDHAEALAMFKEGLDIQHQTRNQAGIAECLAGIATVFVEDGRLEAGARLLSAAETLRESVGAALWPANRVEYERVLSTLHVTMDNASFERVWAEGRTMSMEQAVIQAGSH